MGKKEKRGILQTLNKDNHYLDFWSIVHFLTGVSLGFIFKLITSDFEIALFSTLIFITLWEIFEPTMYRGILKTKFKEKPSNQITDIIFGALGFLAYWAWF